MKQKICINKKGVTLIELLIVIIVVGILAAIAIPLYTGYLERARRADAKTALEQVRACQEMWRAERGRYANDADDPAGAVVTLQTTMGALANPTGYYNWDLTVLNNRNSFTAQAVPFGSQATDGSLFINNLGTKWPADKWAK